MWIDALVATIAVLVVAPLSELINVALALVWPLLIGCLGGYAPRVRRHVRASIQTLSLAAFVLIFITELEITWSSQRRSLVICVLVAFAASTAVRLTASLFRRLQRDRRAGMPVVVVGSRQAVARAVRDLEDLPGHGLGVCAVILLGAGRGAGAGSDPGFAVPSYDGLDAMHEAIANNGASAVLVVPCAELSPDQIRGLAWSLEDSGTELLVSPGLSGIVASRAALAVGGAFPVLHVRAAELRGFRHLIKDAWERTAAFVGLILLAPVLLCILIGIRLDSPGPPIFRQVRVGRDGSLFTMYKMRTMVVSAERDLAFLADRNDAAGPLFKMQEDPRTTRMGRMLRRLSIDEVPQLWNVVRGEMSLVGPRPPLPREVALYDESTRRRMVVKPGLTGLWQVSGRSDLSWERSISLDLHYVDNWSLGLDLRIVLRTARAVLAHNGAY